MSRQMADNRTRMNHRIALINRLGLQRRRWLLAATGIIAVVAVACGGSDGSSAASTGTGSSPAATATTEPAASTGAASSDSSAEAIARELPLDFDISVYQGEAALGGSDVRLSHILARGKPVVLNFWAGLCPPCRAEMPDLQAVNEEFSDHMVLIGLDVGPFTGLGTRDDALDLIEELRITYPAGATKQQQVMAKYKVLGMPSTYFIKPDGSLLQKWTGALNESKLTELVEKLIAASG